MRARGTTERRRHPGPLQHQPRQCPPARRHRLVLRLRRNQGGNIDLLGASPRIRSRSQTFSQFASVTNGSPEISGLTDVFGKRYSRSHHRPGLDRDDETQSAPPPRSTPEVVVLDGPSVTAAVPGVLGAGTPLLRVQRPPPPRAPFRRPRPPSAPCSRTGRPRGTSSRRSTPALRGTHNFDAGAPLTSAAAVAGQHRPRPPRGLQFVIKPKNA